MPNAKHVDPKVAKSLTDSEPLIMGLVKRLRHGCISPLHKTYLKQLVALSQQAGKVERSCSPIARHCRMPSIFRSRQKYRRGSQIAQRVRDSKLFRRLIKLPPSGAGARKMAAWTVAASENKTPLIVGAVAALAVGLLVGLRRVAA